MYMKYVKNVCAVYFLGEGFSWDVMFANLAVEAASVSFFKHVCNHCVKVILNV